MLVVNFEFYTTLLLPGIQELDEWAFYMHNAKLTCIFCPYYYVDCFIRVYVYVRTRFTCPLLMLYTVVRLHSSAFH